MMQDEDIAYWPCGHVRNALNTRKRGDGRESCRQCRIEIDNAAYKRSKGTTTTGAAILAEVAHKYGTTVHAIKSYRGTMETWPAKHEACFRLRQLGWSYPKIARFMGRKNHTTIIHGVRAYRQILANQSTHAA